MKKDEKIFSRDFLLVCLVATLLRICMQFKSSVLPLYVVELGNSKSAAGLTTTAYTIAALVFRPVVGNLIDSLGRKRMLLIGAVIVGITMWPFAFLTAMPLMYLMQVISGIGFSIQSVSLSTMTTDLLTDNKLTEGLGYYGLTSTIAQAIGPAIALTVAGMFGYGVDFISAAGICLLALAAASLIHYERDLIRNLSSRKSAAEEESEEQPRKWWHMIIEPTAVRPGLVMMGVSFTNAAIITFLAAYGAEKNIANIGFFFTAQAIGLAISRIFAGKLTQAFGNLRCLVAGMLLMTLSFFLIHLSASLMPLLLAAVFYSLGQGLAMVILNAWAVLATPKKRRGAANATFYLAQDGGIGLGAAIFGGIADLVGLGKIYLLAGGLMALVMLITIPAVKRMKQF